VLYNQGLLPQVWMMAGHSPHFLDSCLCNLLLLQVRTDLMDTHIAVCAPEVLMLFSDNFDYQNVKRDFVTGGWVEGRGSDSTFWQHTCVHSRNVHHRRWCALVPCGCPVRRMRRHHSHRGINTISSAVPVMGFDTTRCCRCAE
jgi:hypothetical protein